MSETYVSLAEQLALFRYGVIADFVNLPPGSKGLYQQIRKKSPANDHRRFAYQYAGDLFMSDVMHGPSVKTAGNRKRKTYLIAFIDDATRVIPYAGFAYSEKTTDFMAALYPEPGVDLDDLFLFESKRKVQKDRTVSLNGMVYEIHASLVGETVTLRYDPADQGDLIEVCHNGEFIQEAKLVDVYANCFVKRDRPSHSIQEIAKAGQDRQDDIKDARPKPAHPMAFTRITGSDELEDANV